MQERAHLPSRVARRGRHFALLVVALGWLAPATLVGQAVLVYNDGTFEVQKERQNLPAEKIQELHHAWTWANGSAPSRVEPQDFNDASEQESQELRVTLAWAGESLPAGLRLFAAPIDMWTDVPEAVLPSWPVPENGRLEIPIGPGRGWRLRAIAETHGTWWVDIRPDRKNVRLTVLPAEEGILTLLDEEGEPLPDAHLNLAIHAVGYATKPSILARYRSDDEGQVHILGLPDAEAFHLQAFTREHAPRFVTTRISTLPGELRLERGGTLTGQFVDGEGTPLSDVQVRAEAWFSDRVAGSNVSRAATDGEGRWRLDRMPRGKIAVVAAKKGFAPLQRQVQLEGDHLDLGKLTLETGTTIPIFVTDEEGIPVVGALLTTSPGFKTSTDAEGRTLVRPSSGDLPLKVSVRADGHLEVKKVLVAPFPEEARFELRRSFRVEGRLVDEQHVPLSESSIRIRTGSKYRDLEGAFDGRFELDLVPEKPVRLTFRSAATEELRIDLEAGAAGEARDLGDLALASGLRVRGEILRTDGQPVAGARIWCPRPSPQGDVVAWAQGDLVVATSKVDGTFEVLGLPWRPALLRIDAPGLARAHIAVDPQPGASQVDVGVAVLSAGVSVEVLISEEADGAEARVDLRNLWLEPDMLTATVYDGRAFLEHVPPGEVTVTVLKDRELLCEDTLHLAEGERRVSFECDASTMQVMGSVLVGNKPASSGTLVWTPQQQNSAPSIILSFETRSGLTQQQSFGERRPDVRVAVDASGSFVTDKLRPGAWEVSWLPSGGRSLAEAQRLDLPRLDVYETHLSFSELSLSGMVLDPEGQPVERARVRDVMSGAHGLSSPDGRFVLAGLKPGPHQLHARFGERASDIVDIYLEGDKDPEAVLLLLEERLEDRIEITALENDGIAIAGAFVFLESDSQSFQILTTDREGKASLVVLPPYPQRFRAAMMSGGRWALGDWLELETAREGMTLYAAESTGGVVMVSSERAVPEIMTDSGWNMSKLLSSVGLRLTLSPDLQLEIHGLSPGSYHVSIGDVVSSFAIQAADVTEIDIR